MAQTIYPENGDAVDADVHYNLTTAMLCGASFVLYGYDISVDSGLDVEIDNGAAIVGGRLISDTTSTTLSITDDDTRYVYLDNDGTFSELASPDQDKDERLLLAVVVTSGGSISSISHDVFDDDYLHDTYTPSTLTHVTGTIGYDIMLVKGADTTINSDDTINADSDFSWNVDGNQKWEFEYVLQINSVAAADFKYSLNVGSGSNYKGYHWAQHPDGTRTGLTAIGSTEITVATDGTDQLLTIQGWFIPADANLFSLRWSQDASNAGDTTVKANSYVRAKRILM